MKTIIIMEKLIIYNWNEKKKNLLFKFFFFFNVSNSNFGYLLTMDIVKCIVKKITNI